MELQKESNLQKRIERIAQAIYLISNHLKDTEPLKWELRKEGLNFLTCIRSSSEGSDSRDIPADLVIDALSSCAHDLNSYLSLAMVSGLVSRNNANLVMSEITLLLREFEAIIDENTAKAGFILSEDFFATDPDMSRNLEQRLHKGHMKGLISDNKNQLTATATRGTTVHKGQDKSIKNVDKSGDIKDKKDTRQNQIIALLKNRQNLTIKDFVKVITDCSEKTIQRELISLVEKGIVKREGERRWSTYSLK